MNIFRGPESIPELQQYEPRVRRQIWQQHYQSSIISAKGGILVIAYAFCVFCVILVGDILTAPRWVGLVVGNLVGSFAFHVGLAWVVQKRIRIIASS